MLLQFLPCFWALAHLVSATNHSSNKCHHVVHHYTRHDDIHEFLDVKPSYNPNRYPKPGHGPLLVNFSINVRSIFSLDEKEEILSLEASLRMYWKESRVQVLLPEDYPKNYITLHPKMAERFWIPDMFIDRAKAVRIPSYYTRPASLRIYNDSLIRYSSRINFDVACNMEFRMFPVDKQICEVNFESFGYSSDEIQFQWRKDLSNINPNITLTQFNFSVQFQDAYVTDYYDLKYPCSYPT